MLAAFAALGFALSARLILFLAIVGAFALGVMAMLSPSVLKLAIVVCYGALTVIPMVYLELRRRAD
jgi:hypothetical protein